MRRRSSAAPGGIARAVRLRCRTPSRWCDDQPYSPGLSPVETVRERLRGNTLSATAWESPDAIVEACRNVSTVFVGDLGRMVFAANRAWAKVTFQADWH